MCSRRKLGVCSPVWGVKSRIRGVLDAERSTAVPRRGRRCDGVKKATARDINAQAKTEKPAAQVPKNADTNVDPDVTMQQHERQRQQPVEQGT